MIDQCTECIPDDLLPHENDPEWAAIIDALRRSMEEYEAGQGQPAEEALDALRRKHNISRPHYL